MVTRHLRVSGRVQGVGFRAALSDEATRLGVTGWVRNRADGSVEALVQGSTDAMGSIIEWARRGPPAARVVHLEEQPPAAEFDRPYSAFELWPSL
jgi:acylphosphatase